MIVFGPVPSRRLGQSLGINNIPPKTCSYSCVYCQIGRTNHMRVKRNEFYKSEDIYAQVEQKLHQTVEGRIDYLSFVPDGEPALDIHLGRHIDLLRPLGIKIAVITNASLIWMDSVKEDLSKADWVSMKIDAADYETWKKIDRPHGSLKLDKILQAAVEFAKQFEGELVTETMLVNGFNDDKRHITEIAEWIKCINPAKAYLLVPIRPPAESDIFKPSAKALQHAYNIIRQKDVQTECITGHEGDGFCFTEDIVSDLLSISSVHPVREDVILNLLEKRHLDKSIIDQMLDRKLISRYIYEGKTFYRKR